VQAVVLRRSVSGPEWVPLVANVYPAGVLRLCVTESFERFSYYTMATVLVLFLAGSPASGGFGWSAGEAVTFYGTYMGLLWIAPLAGGWVADRWLGARRAVLCGAVAIALGQLMMSSPALLPGAVAWATGVPVDAALAQGGVPLGRVAVDESALRQLEETTRILCSTNLECHARAGLVRLAYYGSAYTFLLGLALLAVGGALLKPSITVMLGQCYRHDDPHRDRGFTLFYVAINIGAVLAGIISGWMAERLGWAIGFMLAASAMGVGIVVLATGASLRLAAPVPAAQAMSFSGRLPQSDRLPRGPLIYVLVLTVVATVFWGAYMQSGGILNLYIYEKVDRSLGAFVVPATWFAVLAPLFVVLAGPVFQTRMDAFAARGRPVDTVRRFIIALILASAAFLTLAAVATVHAPDDRIPMLWPIAIYLVLAIAELALSPAGNAMAARYVPPGLAARMMSIWFLCYAGGSVLAGYLGAVAAGIGMARMCVLTAGLLVLAAVILQLSRDHLTGLVSSHDANADLRNVRGT
jgi:proton-dependent oligopeptide transporter, POT family